METSPTPISYIRTWVPIAIGSFLSWLALHYDVVVDEDASQSLAVGVTALASALYYGVARLLEKVNPIFGYFLGVPKQPVYADGPMIPLAEAQRMAEDAATEAYRQIEVSGGE